MAEKGGKNTQFYEKLMKKFLRKVKKIPKEFVLWKLGGWLRIINKKEYPKNKDGKVFIHVGCGDCVDPRFINLDTRPGLNIHVVEKVENIDKVFNAEFADLIYACHILEHIQYSKVLDTVKKMRRCLKYGGVLRLSVPDFSTMVDMYKESNNIESILRPLLGGQGYEYNFHYSAFDEKYLRNILLEAGFKEVRWWDPKKADDYNFDDWAGKKINLNGKDYPISLNLEAVK
ncbi:MAG: hypothetical protein COV30_01280 [Candidatus Yanofskybacteria bacterium CG10_big_fil_rev_8_21_14_0_10_37_15]|uniref:Methyltransferase type 11 domain-containing protein n=1 Tax=Candidatus Yanofskybacteria bacterium CG10_big_fil_rev_8_21_14_0_10_37_15 TaxID=1975097 RepID=A0A2H0R5K6_9BACT|nr:MAG: hypothetical protein COV30_01280 [Candidatus Yanofskybacteria bacterium CG10_big_fil_rev_8_21_14_0_10_37_15]